MILGQILPVKISDVLHYEYILIEFAGGEYIWSGTEVCKTKDDCIKEAEKLLNQLGKREKVQWK